MLRTSRCLEVHRIGRGVRSVVVLPKLLTSLVGQKVHFSCPMRLAIQRVQCLHHRGLATGPMQKSWEVATSGLHASTFYPSLHSFLCISPVPPVSCQTAHVARISTPLVSLRIPFPIRLALQPLYPQLEVVELIDYRVRLLEPSGARPGTMSTTRVTIDFADQNGGKWTTVSANLRALLLNLISNEWGFK